MEKQLIRKGKVKEVYDLDDSLEFHFTDQVSVFDKIVPNLIPRKGESLCRTAEYWFKRAASSGIHSHFIEAIPPNGMRVKKVDVIADYNRLTTLSKNYLIPLEVICRYYVAGSMHDRLRRGEVLPESLGFPAGKVPDYGAPFPEPLIETTTKLEPVDRPLASDFDYAIEIGFLPGVTDNVGHTAREAICDLLECAFAPGEDVYFSQTAFLAGRLSAEQVESIAGAFANPLIHHTEVLSRQAWHREDRAAYVPRVTLPPPAAVLEVDLALPEAELLRVGREGICDPRGVRRGRLR